MKQVPPTRENLLLLYSTGSSMNKIAAQLNCSVHKVVYWMNKYSIPRRTMSEAIYLFSNPDGDPFNIKRDLNSEEIKLYGIGLGIYWGEGEKNSIHHVRVANTDPFLLRTFISFLINVCRVKVEKIRYSIVCFNDTKPEEAKIFWAKELNISHESFGKIVQIPPQGKGTYRKKSLHGVCTVNVSNTKLKKWIRDELENFKVSFEVEGVPT